jgi:glycerate-2-kinase
VPDANSVAAAEEAMALVSSLSREDTVLFLVSGGGSALFERPLIPLARLEDITGRLLSGGAGIVQINTVRKRLSAVKGGRFALLCAPAKVLSILLSDILGDPPDMIASGPAYPDSSTAEEALEIVRRYDLGLREEELALLRRETPKRLDNAETLVTGSVGQLCRSAEESCRALGYRPLILTDSLSCEAREAGAFLASIAQYHRTPPKASPLSPAARQWCISRAPERAGATRSWLCPPRLVSLDFATPPCFRSARTAPTAPPTPPAAMRTAAPGTSWPKRVFRSPPFCGRTTLITPSGPAAA